MKFIRLDAILAEIERIKEMYCYDKKTNASFVAEAVINSINNAINSLELKEVDLEKKIQDYWNEHQYSHRLQKQVEDGFGESLIRSVAKHFFELGVNASNPLTWEDVKLIWTIGDEIPYMPEEDFFKELLKRFKAQKEEKYDR